MKILLFVMLCISLYGDKKINSFITPDEYAQQLYFNPRGIGCQNCHGDKGEGKLVARYKHKGKEREFRGPAINQLRYPEFRDALMRRTRKMPRYFLTVEEIQALYRYVHQRPTAQKKVP